MSVMGGHAGEGSDAIFDRKAADIQRVGRTFWLIKSPGARPPDVHALCPGVPGYAMFIEPAVKGGARPTTSQNKAVEFSADRESWQRLPEGMSPVTGRVDSVATALVFDILTTDVNSIVDLWQYADSRNSHNPLRFILGRSTICAVKADMTSHPKRMKSRYRQIVAAARLAPPYCVWLR